MPTTEQTLAKLSDAKIMSKLDANSGFWQRKLSENSKLVTTFITPWGRYCFTRLPFGISSAPEHFQKAMQRILEGLDGVECQVDDILVFGETQEQHDKRLIAVLERLADANATLNLEKSKLSTDKVEFLGHVIGKDGVQIDPTKVEAVTQMGEPIDIAQLRQFLGMVNQVGKYIPNLADITKPLRDLLSKNNAWLWTEAQQKAFDDVKKALVSAPTLALYDPANISGCFLIWSWRSSHASPRGWRLETCCIHIKGIDANRTEVRPSREGSPSSDLGMRKVIGPPHR